MSAIPPIVSKRNHFTPADELVDSCIGGLPEEFRRENFRGWLLRYTESVIMHVAMDLATGAQRGIDQAAKLLCDPTYYATKRERRKREHERWEAQKAAQDFDRMERRTCPTAEQIRDEIRYVDGRLAQIPAEQQRLERRLDELKKMTPKNIRFRPQ